MKSLVKISHKEANKTEDIFSISIEIADFNGRESGLLFRALTIYKAYIAVDPVNRYPIYRNEELQGIQSLLDAYEKGNHNWKEI